VGEGLPSPFVFLSDPKGGNRRRAWDTPRAGKGRRTPPTKSLLSILLSSLPSFQDSPSSKSGRPPPQGKLSAPQPATAETVKSLERQCRDLEDYPQGTGAPGAPTSTHGGGRGVSTPLSPPLPPCMGRGGGGEP